MNEEIEQQMESAKWYEGKADELLKQYRGAKTAFEQSRLLPKMDAMMGKMQFQARELKKYLPNET